VLREWLETTEPARIEDAEWGSVVGRRAPRSRIDATVVAQGG
jgi:hypothetical protein